MTKFPYFKDLAVNSKTSATPATMQKVNLFTIFLSVLMKILSKRFSRQFDKLIDRNERLSE